MRRKEIDWLRIFGIFLLFPFHTARVFDLWEPNYVENATVSLAGMKFMEIIWPWFMPLLFFVAGISAFYSLRKRSAATFAGERVMRLLVPFVLGVVFIVPIQGYMARLQEGTLHGTYFNYLFTQFFPDWSDISGYHGTFTPAHLWFILYLFAISMALLPVLSAVLRKRAEKGVGWFGRLFSGGWFLFLLPLYFALFEALPDIGGKNPFFYGGIYAAGFLIASNDEAWKTIDRVKPISAAVLLAATALYFSLRPILDGFEDLAWQSAVLAILRNLYGWSAILVMLGYGQKVLNRGGKVLNYLNTSAFPVYVLHQSVLMVIAYFVVQWSMPNAGKFAIIAVGSLAVSVGLYEICRRVAPLRVLLGIKGNRKNPENSAVSKSHGT